MAVAVRADGHPCGAHVSDLIARQVQLGGHRALVRRYEPAEEIVDERPAHTFGQRVLKEALDIHDLRRVPA